MRHTLVPVAQSPATARTSCCIVAQYAHMGSTPERNGFSICTNTRKASQICHLCGLMHIARGCRHAVLT